MPQNLTTNGKFNINAKCNNFFSSNCNNVLVQNATLSLTRNVTTQNVTALVLINKKENLDILEFFSSLTRPVSQIRKT